MPGTATFRKFSERLSRKSLSIGWFVEVPRRHRCRRGQGFACFSKFSPSVIWALGLGGESEKRRMYWLTAMDGRRGWRRAIAPAVAGEDFARDGACCASASAVACCCVWPRESFTLSLPLQKCQHRADKGDKAEGVWLRRCAKFSLCEIFSVEKVVLVWFWYLVKSFVTIKLRIKNEHERLWTGGDQCRIEKPILQLRSRSPPADKAGGLKISP